MLAKVLSKSSKSALKLIPITSKALAAATLFLAVLGSNNFLNAFILTGLVNILPVCLASNENITVENNEDPNIAPAPEPATPVLAPGVNALKAQEHHQQMLFLVLE